MTTKQSRRLSAPALLLAATVVVAVLVGGFLLAHRSAGPAGTVDPQVAGLPGWAESLPAPKELKQVTSTSGLLSMPWRYVGKDAAGTQLELVIVEGDGSCTLPEGVVVEESSDAVELTVVSRTDPAQKACASRLETARAYVTLAQPLGTRQLIHAPVTPPWDAPMMLAD